MPKIRLSALATDIKGKSGGSVFSTNAGGTYFRNNPSGTGSKKPATSVRKQLFASLSQSWRALTDAQQQAWTDAGVLYKTTNAWGEPRTPKGFELYMRLNGNLQAAGENLLLVPVHPEPIPSLGSPEFSYSSKFQLIGQRGFAPNTPALYDMDLGAYGLFKDFIQSGLLVSNGTFSFRFSLNNSETKAYTLPSQINLFTLGGSDYIFVRLSDASKGDYYLKIDIQIGEYNVSCQSVNFSSELLKDCSLSFQFFTDLDISPVFLINGESMFLSVSRFGTPEPTPTGNFDLKLGGSNMPASMPIFQDFRYYNSILGDEDLLLISRGYILTTEKYLYPLSQITERGFIPYTSQGSPMEIVTDFPNPYSSDFFLQNYSASLVPNIVLSVKEIKKDYLRFQICVSQFLSTGVNSISAVKKTVGYFLTNPVVESSGPIPALAEAMAVYATSAKQTIDIYNELKSLLNATIGGTTIFVQIRLLDVNTGEVGVFADVVPATGKKPRFKAGAELMGKVN